MNRPTGKVIDCSIGEAKARRDQARAYIDVAEMVLADSASRYEAQVAAALAVLAAIAAADAVCGLKLHRYSRGQDHAQAVALLETVDVDDYHCRPSCAGSWRQRTPCITPHIWSQNQLPGAWCDRLGPSSWPLTGCSEACAGGVAMSRPFRDLRIRCLRNPAKNPQSTGDPRNKLSIFAKVGFVAPQRLR